MIVEDEKPIRAGIRRMLEEFFEKNPHLPYEIMESSGGRDAYRKCTSGAVDILITDIKMPAMSGISLAKKLVNEKLPMHMLAISGYQDYEYVREMMKLGVHDYLLKPIDRRQLYEAMEYFVTHLHTARNQENGTLLYEQRLLERMLLDTSDVRGELDQFLSQRGLDRSTPCQLLLVSEKQSEEDQPFGLYHMLRAQFGFGPDFSLVQGSLDGHWAVVVLGYKPLDEYVNVLAQKIESAGHTITGRLGPVLLCDARALGAQHRLAFYDLPVKTLESTGTQAVLDRITGIMAATDPAPGLQEAVDCLFRLYQAAKTPLNLIKKDISGLLYQLMSKSVDYIEFISKVHFTRYDPMECFEDASCLSQLKRDVLETLEHLLEQFRSRCETNADTIFAQAKAYIQAHYAQDLKLTDVAAIVHLHPNYFSSLFSQKLGLTFRDYLRGVRIEAAIRLIQEAKHPMDEISIKVGYSDTAHFFRAFKSVTGTTPKAHKQHKYRSTKTMVP
jgi:two-component system response regulator YesN